MLERPKSAMPSGKKKHLALNHPSLYTAPVTMLQAIPMSNDRTDFDVLRKVTTATVTTVLL